jgi:broad specificity phosphatase PhoE
MRRFLVLLLGCVLLLASASAAFSQRALIVVRHAEKVDDSDDSPLNQDGYARAQALARLLKDSGITAIYTTEFQRTQNTIKPLAQLLNVQPVAVPQKDLDELVRQIRANHPNETVLVAGHRGTVPRILKKFGCASDVQLTFDEFNSLFILAPAPQGPPVVLHLRF